VISLKLVRLIECHSEQLAAELVVKLETSSRTANLHKVPVEELRGRIHEGLRHFSEWLLTKTGYDIEQHYFEICERRFCWAIAMTKEHLWEFLQRQAVMRGPVDIYGEMELLRLLDQFFDRALCFATKGYEQYIQQQVTSGGGSSPMERWAWH